MATPDDPTGLFDFEKRTYGNNHTDNITSLSGYSSAPSQINIGGNARVQVGDQYSNGVKSVTDHHQPTGIERPTTLSIVCTAIRAIEFSLLVISSVDDNKDRIYRPLHAQLARDKLWHYHSSLRASITALDQSTSTDGQRSATMSGLGDSILVELLQGSANIADSLAKTLDEIYTAARTRAYSSLREMIVSVNTDERVVHDMLESLDNLGGKAVLAVLILLKSVVISNEPITFTSVERYLLTNVRTLWKEHQAAINSLYSATSSWFSIPWTNSKAAAVKWSFAHSSIVQETVQSVLGEVTAERHRSVRLRIVDSLDFTEMDRRYQAIPQAHSRTLQWLYLSDNYDTSVSQHNFARWLQNTCPRDSRLYWVRGKPGSGKSTLMRHLLDDSRTRRLGQTWAGGKKLYVVSCFFWSSGTKLQKSQEGLLQTLLYKLLIENGSFSHCLFRQRWSLLELGSQSRTSWSVSELRYAIFRFIADYCDQVNVLFLIDGLDEYQGTNEERETICMLLKDLSQHNNIKVCASSRPLNVYKDAFRNKPQLRLEFLTRQSIKVYIKDHFEANERYRQWSVQDLKGAEYLIDDLWRRASGVFLWVRIVVKILLRGLQDGDDIHDLRCRLNEIPVDLEDLFRRLLSQIEPAYLESASKTFELVLRESKHDNLAMIHYLIHEHRNSIESSTLTPALSLQEVVQKQEMQERRINAQCMGLLELVPIKGDDMHSYHVVEFLHRTARDFMATDEIYRRLRSWRNPSWNMTLVLLVARIRLLQSYRPRQRGLPIETQLDLIGKILRNLANGVASDTAMSLLSATEQHFNHLLNAAQRHYQRHSTNNLPWVMNHFRHYETDFLGLAIDEGATSYVQKRLSTMRPSEVSPRRGRPLLDFALLSPIVKNSTPSEDLVDRLLALGANSNDHWDGWTIWERFLSYLIGSMMKPDDLRTYVGLTRALILGGASDRVHVWGTTATQATSLEYVLKLIFPKEEAEELWSGAETKLETRTGNHRATPTGLRLSPLERSWDYSDGDADSVSDDSNLFDDVATNTTNTDHHVHDEG